uniref:RNA helicase n=1 Tax=viral metagenome TaxID=1070528 RepID=A0A6C0EHH6_9ZZZZ
MTTTSDTNTITSSDELEICDNFDDMGLSDELLRGIYANGFEKPSAIQTKAIKPLITGRDIIAQAQSGTGKTGTFLIGSLQRVDLSLMKPQVVVLAPNRELAIQIHTVMKSISNFLNIKSALLIGGVTISDNFKVLDEGVQFIVGTPGRVYDMIKRYALKTTDIKSFILDEADEMLSRGFKDQIYEIFQYIPKETQICIFSATLPQQALEVTEKFMNNPLQILVKKEELTLEGIQQYYLGLEQESWKIATLIDLYDKLSISQSIIFANSRRKAEYIKEQLMLQDHVVHYIHGEMTQDDRNDVMEKFRLGQIRILISTDIIARGIDIQQVSIVINYDIPKYREVYIHRIGRSGRYGRKGTAINFVTDKEYQHLRDIMEFYQTDIQPLPENIKELI